MQCDLCDSWVHIACNNLNLYTYRKLQKDKSPWYCMCWFRKELPYEFINDTKFRNLLHGEAIVSPNPKIISSIIKQSEYFDEEMLKKRNNRFYTPDEYNLLSNLKIKPNINRISETRLQRGKQPITNIFLPNYVYEHTPTETGKGGTI